METKNKINEPPKYTFEMLIEAQMETAKQMKEMSAEADKRQSETAKQIKEMSVEADKRRIEADKRQAETEKQMKKMFAETNKKISHLGDRLGDIVQHLVSPNIKAKYAKLGYIFDSVSTRFKGYDEKGNVVAEVDVFLQNGSLSLAVEIKSHLRIDDVDYHLQRLEKMRLYEKSFKLQDSSLMGAVAAAVIPANVKEYAFKKGFFVMEQTGDTMSVEPPPQKDGIKKW